MAPRIGGRAFCYTVRICTAWPAVARETPAGDHRWRAASFVGTAGILAAVDAGSGTGPFARTSGQNGRDRRKPAGR